MARDESDRSDHPQAPWWWGTGPIGAALLVLSGLAFGLWQFLTSDSHDPFFGYESGKVVAIGLVILGSATLDRLRSRRLRTRETGDRKADED